MTKSCLLNVLCDVVRGKIKLKFLLPFNILSRSVDNNLFKEQHRSMPISSERNSRVTFGSGRGNDKN